MSGVRVSHRPPLCPLEIFINLALSAFLSILTLQNGLSIWPGKIRCLLPKDRRYFVRLTVPPDLREYLQGDDKGKRELREPVCGDRRIAIKLPSGAVADIQARIGIAEANRAKPTSTAFNAMRYPMSIEGIA
jgi:hypothetical protein